MTGVVTVFVVPLPYPTETLVTVASLTLELIVSILRTMFAQLTKVLAK